MQHHNSLVWAALLTLIHFTKNTIISKQEVAKKKRSCTLSSAAPVNSNKKHILKVRNPFKLLENILLENIPY